MTLLFQGWIVYTGLQEAFLGIVKVCMSTKCRENRLTFEYLIDCFVFINPTTPLCSRLSKQATGASTQWFYVHTGGVLLHKIPSLLLMF